MRADERLPAPSSSGLARLTLPGAGPRPHDRTRHQKRRYGVPCPAHEHVRLQKATPPPTPHHHAISPRNDAALAGCGILRPGRRRRVSMCDVTCRTSVQFAERPEGAVMRGTGKACWTGFCRAMTSPLCEGSPRKGLSAQQPCPTWRRRARWRPGWPGRGGGEGPRGVMKRWHLASSLGWRRARGHRGCNKGGRTSP